MLYELLNWPGPMTHRQFVVWNEWSRRSMNVPGLTEYYLAQVACEVRRVLSTKPSSIKLEDMILEFKEDKRKDPEAIKRHTEYAKAAWVGRMGMTPTVLKPEEATWVYPSNYTGVRYDGK